MINWKKNVTLFLGGSCITMFGSMLVQQAVVWYITLETQSGTIMAIMTAAGGIPMLLASPFAGIWSDRYSKKLIINIADGVIAVVTLLLAITFSLGFEHIALLIVILAIRGFGAGVQAPAVNSFLPEIVPEDKLIRVNGFNSSIQSVVSFLSPIAGAALIATVAIQSILYIDVVTAAIGISILVFFVKSAPPREVPKERKPAFREISEGLKYIKTQPFIIRMILVALMVNIFAAPAAQLNPLQTVRYFGEEPWRLMVGALAFSAGMFTGGAIIGAWGGFKNKIHTLSLGLIAVVFCTIGIAFSARFGEFILYAVFTGIYGIFLPVFNAPVITILQTKVDPDYMGRVFSAFMVVNSFAIPVSMAAWGPLADIISINTLQLVSTLGITAATIFVLSSKSLRQAGKA
jgi:DHA3 family macrolide efflux protein-like MFS transporter